MHSKIMICINCENQSYSYQPLVHVSLQKIEGRYPELWLHLACRNKNDSTLCIIVRLGMICTGTLMQGTVLDQCGYCITIPILRRQVQPWLRASSLLFLRFSQFMQIIILLCIVKNAAFQVNGKNINDPLYNDTEPKDTMAIFIHKQINKISGSTDNINKVFNEKLLSNLIFTIQLCIAQ